jgi:hypothetical protein
VLTGAKLCEIETGQSQWQLGIRLVISVLGIVASAAIGAFAGVETFTGHYTSAIGVAFAGAVVGALVASGIFDRSVALLAAVAFIIALAGTVAFTVAFVGAAVEAFSRPAILTGLFYSTIATLMVLGMVFFFLEIMKRARNFTGTYFTGADLTHADFSHSLIKNADFSNTCTDFTNWTGTRFVGCQLPTLLNSLEVLQLCTLRDGRGCNYYKACLSNMHLARVNLAGVNLNQADLSYTNLEGANLEGANLSDIQAAGTNFSGAQLTGACIRDWCISSETILTGVKCDYIYLEFNQGERRPTSGCFQPGEFEQMVKSSSN